MFLDVEQRQEIYVRLERDTGQNEIGKYTVVKASTKITNFRSKHSVAILTLQLNHGVGWSMDVHFCLKPIHSC